MTYLIILMNLCWSQPQQQPPQQQQQSQQQLVVKGSSAAPSTPTTFRENGNTLNLSDFNGSKSQFITPKDGYGAEEVRFNFADSEFKNTTLDIKKKAIKRELKTAVLQLFSDKNIFMDSLTKKDIEGLISFSLKELESSVDSCQNDIDLQYFKYNNVRGYLIRSLVNKYLSHIYASTSNLQLENKNLKLALESLQAKVTKDKELEKNNSQLLAKPSSIYDYLSILSAALVLVSLVFTYRRTS